MSGITDLQRKRAKLLQPHLDKVAEFFSKKMKIGAAMPAADIYKAVGNLPMTVDEFKMGLSVCVKYGLLTGTEGRKRAGFRYNTQVKVVNVDLDAIEGASPPSPKPSEPANDSAKQPDNDGKIPRAVRGTTIMVTDAIRIRADKYNWTLQKRTGETWTSHRYWPDLLTALRRCADYMLEQNIRSKGTVVESSVELIALIQETEERIIKLLEGKEHVMSEAPDDEEEAA